MHSHLFVQVAGYASYRRFASITWVSHDLLSKCAALQGLRLFRLKTMVGFLLLFTNDLNQRKFETPLLQPHISKFDACLRLATKTSFWWRPFGERELVPPLPQPQVPQPLWLWLWPLLLKQRPLGWPWIWAPPSPLAKEWSWHGSPGSASLAPSVSKG